MNPPIPLGTIVLPWGEIAGVRFDGERYYFLINESGVVSYLPASTVERADASADEGQKP